MADQRDGGIAWTDESWNPIRARETGRRSNGRDGWHCVKVSEACSNCYAEEMNKRLGTGMVYAESSHHSAHEIFLDEKLLVKPLHWKRPRKIFLSSMTDIFADFVEDDDIAQIFGVAIAAHHLRHHIIQVLTKRAERMQELLSREEFWELAMCFADAEIMECVDPLDRRSDDASATCDDYSPDNPPPGIWLGVTAENQKAADERIPLLLRWVSIEPLLGHLDLAAVTVHVKAEPGDWFHYVHALTGDIFDDENGFIEKGPKLDWVVAGGESGKHARPSHPDWFRSLRAQCNAAGVPFLFKQWGEWHTSFAKIDTGEAVFRQFRDFDQWVNKASTWVNGGICLDADGRVLTNGAEMQRARDEGKFPVTIMHRVGKEAAGRLLDGVLHDAFPEVRP